MDRQKLFETMNIIIDSMRISTSIKDYKFYLHPKVYKEYGYPSFRGYQVVENRLMIFDRIIFTKQIFEPKGLEDYV